MICNTPRSFSGQFYPVLHVQRTELLPVNLLLVCPPQAGDRWKTDAAVFGAPDSTVMIKRKWCVKKSGTPRTLDPGRRLTTSSRKT